VARAGDWDGFRLTLLDEGGSAEPWLWEVLADAQNFFPDSSHESQVEVAERLIRELIDDGWASLAWPDGTPVLPGATDTEVMQGRWRKFPPAPDGDVRLIPTAKWKQWSMEART
jgi:hypothetical protein